MSSHIPLPKEKHSQTKLYVTLSSLTSKKREDRRCIETHPFNYRCTILTSTPLQKQTVLKHIGGYYRVKLKPSDLISPDFINGYVKPDTIVALSLESRIDTGDVIAIDGQGTLILSLCKDTYEELGIVGSKAQFPLDDGSRHIVRIDLKAGVMDPSKKYYQRIKWRFDEVLDREMDFLLGRFDCKTGAALNFDMPGAMQCSPAVEEHVLRDIWVPGVDELFDESAKRPSDVWTERVSDIFEWIGVAASGTDGAQRLLSAKTTPAMAAATSDICTYSVDEPRSSQTLYATSVSGLISAKAISSLLESIVADSATDNSNVILCVWGHEDAPVSWAANEHSYLVSGENLYAQIHRPHANQCLTFQACGPWDAFS